MSINKLIERKGLAEIDALANILGDFISRWRGASTLEQRSSIEVEAIALFEKLNALDLDFSEIQPGQEHTVEEVSDYYSEHRYLLKVNVAKLKRLIQQFINYSNTEQIALLSLTGKLKRIRQKKAALSLFNQSQAVLTLAEHFLNLDALSTNFLQGPVCQVEVTEGALLLPVESSVKSKIQKFTIGNNSTGSPGDPSDISNPKQMLDVLVDDGVKGFVYQRLNSGPLDLFLKVELAGLMIINQLYIEPLALDGLKSFDLVDATFVNDSGSVDLLSLVGQGVDQDLFSIKVSGNDQGWRCSFLPIKTRTVVLHFRQTSSRDVQVFDKEGAVVFKAQWAIAIKKLEFLSVKYSSAGSISSKSLPLPTGLNGLLPFVEVWPPQKGLYKIDYEASFDEGATWKHSPDLEDGIGELILLDGFEKSLIWKLKVQRLDEAFANSSSFIPVPEQAPKLGFLQRMVSRAQNPSAIQLTSMPDNAEVSAYQPKLARRGSYQEAVKVDHQLGAGGKARLPVDFISYGVKPEELKIFVNRTLSTYDPDGTDTPASGTWSLSEDHTHLIFPSDVEQQTLVHLCFEEEQMSFIKGPRGYLHKVKMPFDPDVNLIKVRYAGKEPAKRSVRLPTDEKTIQLVDRNIVPDSDQLFVDGALYTRVGTRGSLGAQTYWINYEKGIIVLYEELGTSTARFSYEHWESKVIPKEKLKIYFENQVPAYIGIAEGDFESRTVVDQIGTTSGKQYSYQDNTWETRPYVQNNDYLQTLSETDIIEGTLKVASNLFVSGNKPIEVSYRDGYREFLGLVEVTDEFTNETAPTMGVVQFQIAAGALWDPESGISFSNTGTFLNKESLVGDVDSLGDWHISDGGLVTVYTGGGNLPAGIKYGYFYRNPNVSSVGRYSVDYKNGFLYSYEELNPGAEIEYESVNYVLAYDVVKPISSKYDRKRNLIAINVDDLTEANSFVKILWAQKIESTLTLADVKSYFSPIITILGSRFE